MVEESPSSGGEPELFVKCTECGSVQTAQRTGESLIRPIGTNGSCECGSTEFDAYTDT